jgi:hypothetical protein
MIRVVVLLALLTTAATPAAPLLSLADQAAAFRAAGFTRTAGKWQACGDPGTASYSPGKIETVRDINGDGRPDAVITEGSSFCFGGTEVGYAVVSKQANNSWRLITGGPGIARFLPRTAKDRTAPGWPDLEVGGPGFCFPVERWNGREYVVVRYQYQGKRCRPGG